MSFGYRVLGFGSGGCPGFEPYDVDYLIVAGGGSGGAAPGGGGGAGGAAPGQLCACWWLHHRQRVDHAAGQTSW